MRTTMDMIRSLIATTALVVAGTCTAQLGVTAGEYFWDTDPGAGNGTALTAADGSFGSVVEAVMTSTAALPPTGTHTFSVRVRDEDGHWGPVFSTVVESWAATAGSYAQRVDLAEFFWDTDPGQGNGTALVAFDGSYDSALEQVVMSTTALPAIGTHTLHLRARDAQGAWGPLFSVVVEIAPNATTFPEIRVARAEYWFDADPGAGLATPMFAQDGDFGTVVEGLKGSVIPVPVEAGVHVLWMRAGDPNNGWGPPFGIVVNMDTTLTGSVGVANTVQDRDVRVMPNPTEAAQGFTVALPKGAHTGLVQVLDPQGRLVFQQRYTGTDRIVVPMGAAAAGAYTVSIEVDGTVHRQRVIVR